MNEKIVEMLHLSLEPVGIFLGNTSAICELEASPQKRNCVIPFVLAAAKGKITSLDEDGCTCPGGAVGACFGDGFTRLNPSIHVMLSHSHKDLEKKLLQKRRRCLKRVNASFVMRKQL